MIAAGVIVEYNPFHNGHFFHISETKKITDSDVTIAIMSGNFLQRGEPALVSKWSRTKMALQGGADLVIELPYVFATQKADTFALGSISLLHALGAKSVCFGSENGKIEDFIRTLSFMENNKEIYEKALHDFIKSGVSYPRAASLAFQTIDKDGTYLDLSKPNNILGFQYLNAIKKINSSITPVTIERSGSQYHDKSFSSQSIASATSIRKTLFHSRLSQLDESIKGVVPTYTFKELKDYQESFGMLHDWEDYFSILAHIINTASLDELRMIYEMEEGLEYRLKERINSSTSFEHFIQQVKTKRYTWTRLQRMCTHILTNSKKEEMKEHMKIPTYIRVLGMSEEGQQYLNFIKKSVELPLVTKVSTLANNEQLKIDHRAALSYAAPLGTNRIKSVQKEFKNAPVRYNRKSDTFLS